MAADWDAQVERVWALVEEDRNREALGLARQVLAAEPTHYGALQAAAWLLEVAGDFESSAALARRLIGQFPDDVAGYWRMTTLLFGQERYAEAEPYIRKAAELDPDDASFHESLATVLIDRRDWVAALAPLEQAVALDSEDSGYRFRLGIVLTRLGRAGEAVPHLTAALDLGADREQLETILTVLETYGLPSAVRPVYRRICELLGRADLTVPGAAGRDKALLQAQAEIAERLAMPVGQSEPTSRASWELARVLAEGVLAVQRRNTNARNTLEILQNHEGIPFALYSDPDAARKYGRRLTDLGRRFSEAGTALAENPGLTTLNEAFAVAGELLRTFEAAGMNGTTEQEAVLRDITELVDGLRNGGNPSPADAAEVARSLEASGLADAFPAFHHWLATGAPAAEPRGSGPDSRHADPDDHFTSHARDYDGHRSARGLD